MEVNRRGRSLVCLRDRKNAQKFQQFGRKISRRFQNGIFAKKTNKDFEIRDMTPFFMPICHVLVQRNTNYFLYLLFMTRVIFFLFVIFEKERGIVDMVLACPLPE